MTELLRVDLRRILKDKLLLVVIILTVVFALSTPLLYALIFSSGEFANDPMLANLISAKALFFSNFSLGNNLGLLAPVLLAIVLCKDFSFGTVRNKIIVGKSRSAMFLSMFISCAVVLTGVILLGAFLSLLTSLCFFDYQATPFTAADFGYFVVSLVFDVLVLIFASALLSCLCACAKNVGIAIVLYVGFTLLLVMIGSILQVVIMVLEAYPEYKTLLKILQVAERLNVGMAVNYIGAGTSYTVEDVLYLTLPPLVGTAGFLSLGLYSFNRKNLK